jgi:sulfur carrier protein
MQVVVNGTPTDVPESIDMSGLIQQLGLENRRLAVELNREIVPRSRFAEQPLQAGDRIEIIHAVGGG